MRRLPFLSLIAGLLSATPVLADTASLEVAAPPPKTHIPHEAEMTEIVVDYVRNNRGWPDGVYKVSYDSRDGDRLIFSVDFLRGDSSANFVGIDGSSFKVVVNTTSKRVEKELYAQ
jgi:hypothetical protein